MERSIGDLWRNAEGGGAKQRSKRTVGELRRGVCGVAEPRKGVEEMLRNLEGGLTNLPRRGAGVGEESGERARGGWRDLGKSGDNPE